MELLDAEKLIVEMAKLCVGNIGNKSSKTINKVLASDLPELLKEEIRMATKDSKPIQIVTDFDERTESKILKEDYVVECGNHVPIYTITDMRDLVQFVGYCKYTNAEHYNVYMRGQPNLYNGKMIPSIYRGQSNYSSTALNFRKRLNQSIRSLKILSGYDKKVVEPMLQHYGVKTTSTASI